MRSIPHFQQSTQDPPLTQPVVKANNTYHYTGTSLLPAQITTITSLPASPSQTPFFFGRHDTSGILGFIHPSQSTLTTFSTPSEIAQGALPVSTTSFATSPWTIHSITFTAADATLVHVAPRNGEQATIIELPSLQHLHDFLESPNADYIARTTFPPARVTTNIATLTALSQSGTLHTLATDRRFARAAGRDPDVSSETVQPVPFLEQSAITKVAAGGLYTAALADDGELFMWGQAIAGTPGELRCLVDRDDDDDEYVRTVSVGEGVRVVDVAVGPVHVLVAGEGGGSKWVWAAGDNRHGALGLGVEMEGKEFVEEFVVVEGLKGKRVKQMVCAGMSSYVVVKADSKDKSEE